MQMFGDKILVRITSESREGVFSKKIVRNDGTTTKLFINVDADAVDERKSSLFVQTGVVEAVSDQVKGVQVGDIALLDYTLCNSEINFFKKDNDGELYWLNATTTYHKETMVANQTRRSRRDQIIHKFGEIDEISMLLGIVRGDEIIARRPYVFLEHLPTTIIKTTFSGIQYNEQQKIIQRKVLGVDEQTTKFFSIQKGDTVLVKDADVFMVSYEGKKIDCINDGDCLGAVKTPKLKLV